ncbi:hypothetical protein MMC07_007784 [Pseudocyphellaria aurata]|nr:hypothetical protein [Pseudocyphellaria aurata]
MASPTPLTAPLDEAYLQEYNGHKLIAASVALMVLEILFVGLRFLSRRLSKTAMGLDDWLIGPSFVFCVGLTVASIYFVQYAGAGRHVEFWVETDPGIMILWGKTRFVVEYVYTAAFTFPRLSILAMYMRIFTTRGYRIAVYTLALTLILLYITTIFLSSLKCLPLAYAWDKTIPGGRCIDITSGYLWITFPNVLIDTAILILPLPVIWHLHVSTMQKIGLIVTFLTGGIGLIASIIRFIIFANSNSEEISDGTWITTDLMILTCLEPGVYLMAACLPTYRPLVSLVCKFISSSLLLSRARKQDAAFIFSPALAAIGDGTLGGTRAEVRFLAGNGTISIEEDGERELVNHDRGDEEPEVRSLATNESNV